MSKDEIFSLFPALALTSLPIDILSIDTCWRFTYLINRYLKLVVVLVVCNILKTNVLPLN